MNVERRSDYFINLFLKAKGVLNSFNNIEFIEAKKYALIMVNEIIQELDKDSENYTISLDYWKDVELTIIRR